MTERPIDGDDGDPFNFGKAYPGRRNSKSDVRRCSYRARLRWKRPGRRMASN